MTYLYECKDCGRRHEKNQPMSAKADPACPHCQKLGCARVITGGCGIIFKGDGFYCTNKIYKANCEDEPWKKNYQGYKTG
jgi:putative FmdB family regulatory protein